MTDPVNDPDVLAAFNASQVGKPITSEDVIAAFNPAKRSHLVQGGAYAEDPETPEWQEKYGSLSGTNFLEKAMIGAGSVPSDLALGGKQIYAQARGRDPYAVTDPFTGLTSEEKRTIDEPIAHTAGGRLGQAFGYSPTLFIPGVNTWGGASILGTALGAFQPTTPGESRIANAGIGGVLGGGSQALGSALGQWASRRAQEPLMGWRPKAVDQAAASSVGSVAPRLDQDALREAHDRFTDIFSRARSPDVSIPVGDQTLNALESSGQGLNSSSRTAFYANSEVKDLTAHLGSNPSAAQLGEISSRLGTEGRSQLTGKGDRALGRTLLGLQDHVDGLVGSSITDPALKASYDAALPQYRNFLTLRGRPALLNSSTGEVNATALGRYLQRADPRGYAEGGNTSPLYEAARWGQATGQGKGAPPFSLENLGLRFAAYHAANNPVSRAATGVTSRAVAPISNQTGRLAQALALAQKSRAQEPAQRLISAEQAQ